MLILSSVPSFNLETDGLVKYSLGLGSAYKHTLQPLCSKLLPMHGPVLVLAYWQFQVDVYGQELKRGAAVSVCRLSPREGCILSGHRQPTNRHCSPFLQSGWPSEPRSELCWTPCLHTPLLIFASPAAAMNIWPSSHSPYTNSRTCLTSHNFSVNAILCNIVW